MQLERSAAVVALDGQGVGRVRDQPVEGGLVEPNGLGVVLARRVPGQLLERGHDLIAGASK
jgi:hypothetical protein